MLEFDGAADRRRAGRGRARRRRPCKWPATGWSRAATVPTAGWPAIRASFSATSVRRETPDGPDDWFTISGHARGGDSGGGVFNEQGQLVGVLWGTDGQEVVCVQAGRLHKLLDQAVVQEDAAQQKSILQRVPTPAKPPPNSDCCPGGDCAAVDRGRRRVEESGRCCRGASETKSRDDAQDARIEALIELQERQAKAAVPAPPRR